MKQDPLDRYINIATLAATIISALLLFFTKYYYKIQIWLLPFLEFVLPLQVSIWLAVLISLMLPVVAPGIVMYIVLLVFQKRSVLVHPTAFSLDIDNEGQLYGRRDEIAALVDYLTNDGKLIFLDGESGVGKTALLRAGVLPALHNGGHICPVYFVNYETEWNTANWKNLIILIKNSIPTAEYEKITPDGRLNPLEVSFPDVFALLDKIPEKLGKIPLIIFDQFDDYQLRFRSQFSPPGSGWITVEHLYDINPFWGEIGKRVASGALKAIFATRKDAASGLFSVEFAKAKVKSLDRLPADALRNLLNDLPERGAKHPAIQDPEHGWNQLKLVLEDDLNLNGGALPQEIRVVLLSLRQMPYLTTAAYKREGGLSGLKVRFVRETISRAAKTHGLSEMSVLEIVKCMVLPAASQSSEVKTQAIPIQEIVENSPLVQNMRQHVQDVLNTLEREELVRPRLQSDTASELWQLDHDYLANAVLEAEAMNKKWAIRLERGDTSWRRAAGDYIAWRTLLSIREQIAIAFERALGRLRYGQYRRYAVASLLRFVPFLLIALFSTVLYININDYLEIDFVSRPIIDAIGLGGATAPEPEAQAILLLARAPSAVKNEVFARLLSTEAGREKAARRAMPLIVAVANLDPALRSHRIDQLVEIAAQEQDHISSLLNIAQMIEAAEPNAEQARAVINFAINAIRHDPTNASTSLLCNKSMAFINFLHDKQVDALTLLIRQTLESLGTSDEDIRNSPDLDACLLNSLKGLSPRMSSVGRNATAQMLWRRMASISDLIQIKNYSDVLREISTKLPQPLLRNMIADLFNGLSVTGLPPTRKREDARLTLQRFLTFSRLLSAEDAENVWEDIDRSKGLLDIYPELTFYISSLVADIAPKLGKMAPEVFSYCLQQATLTNSRQYVNYRINATDWQSCLIATSITSDASQIQYLSKKLLLTHNDELGRMGLTGTQIRADLPNFNRGVFWTKFKEFGTVFGQRLDDTSRELFLSAVISDQSNTDFTDFVLHFLIKNLNNIKESEQKTLFEKISSNLTAVYTDDNCYTYIFIFPLMSVDDKIKLIKSINVMSPVGFNDPISVSCRDLLIQQSVPFIAGSEADSILMRYWTEKHSPSLPAWGTVRNDHLIPLLVARLQLGAISMHMKAFLRDQDFNQTSAAGEIAYALAQRLDQTGARLAFADAQVALASPDLPNVTAWVNVIAGISGQLSSSDLSLAEHTLIKFDAIRRKAGKYSELGSVNAALAKIAGMIDSTEANMIVTTIVDKTLNSTTTTEFLASYSGLVKINSALSGVISKEQMLKILSHPWVQLSHDSWHGLISSDIVEGREISFWSAVEHWKEQKN